LGLLQIGLKPGSFHGLRLEIIIELLCLLTQLL